MRWLMYRLFRFGVPPLHRKMLSGNEVNELICRFNATMHMNLRLKLMQCKKSGNYYEIDDYIERAFNGLHRAYLVPVDIWEKTMKVRFKASFGGFKIDETVGGKNPDEVVTNLRNQIAAKIPHIPIMKKDDELREKLDVDGKDDWANKEFYTACINYYNTEQHKKAESMGRLYKPAPIPETAADFIGLATRLNMASFVNE